MKDRIQKGRGRAKGIAGALAEQSGGRPDHSGSVYGRVRNS